MRIQFLVREMTFCCWRFSALPYHVTRSRDATPIKGNRIARCRRADRRLGEWQVDLVFRHREVQDPKHYRSSSRCKEREDRLKPKPKPPRIKFGRQKPRKRAKIKAADMPNEWAFRRVIHSARPSKPIMFQQTACTWDGCMKKSDPGRAHIQGVREIRTLRIKRDLAREPESP